MTRDKRSSELEHRDTRDPLDPFFEGLGPAIGKLTRVSAELEAGARAASLPPANATPGRGPSVSEAYRMSMLTGPAASGDSEGHGSLPGESEARDVLSALQLSRISRGRMATPVLSAAIERTFGVRDDVPVETGAAPPSGSGGSRGYAINGRAYIATAEPDLTTMADRQVIGHEFAHALQQRRGTGLAATRFDAQARAALEAEAVAAGSAFASGQRFAVSGRAPAEVALYDDERKQVTHITLLGDLLIFELEDQTKETVRTIYNGKLEPGIYTYDTATRKIGPSGATDNANGNILEYYTPPDIKLDGLPSITLEVSGTGRGGAHTAHRVQAEPQLAVAVPGTKVKYYVAMDPEIGGSYDFRWYCINDPASVGGNIPPRVDGPTEGFWNAQWAVPGRHTVVCELTFHGSTGSSTEKLEFFQQVATESQVLDEQFKSTRAPEYGRFRAALELQNLALHGGGLPDQRTETGPYIQASGANPAVPGIAPNLASNTYTIAPSPKAKKFRWYARCASWDGMPTQSFFGYHRIQVDGEDALDLHSNGPSAQFIIAERNKYTIVCEELDDQGLKLGSRATYVQVVESQDQADKRAEWQKYMAHADAAIGKIADGKEVGLHAVYINRETGQQVSMQLYVGPDAGDPSKVVLVDLLPGADRLEYGGNTIDDALRDFEDGNAYPRGSIKLEVPANKSGIPTRSRTLITNGESTWAAWSSRLGLVSLGLAGLGVVAALIPGGQPVAGALFIAAAATGATASGLDLYDRLQKAEKSPVGIALDVAGIAASVVGGATAFRALRVGSALTFTGTAGKFLFYAGFTTNAVAGLLISVEGVDEIVRVLDSEMPRGEKISAIVRILTNLILQGALLALSVRDVNQMRARIGQLIGEEATSGLAIDVLHSLNLLDDTALGALKGLAPEKLTAVAEIARLNPAMARRLATIASSDLAGHDIVAVNDLVSFDGQIKLDPAKLATLTDGQLRDLMRASKLLSEAGGDLTKLSQADQRLVKGLTGSSGAGLRLRFEYNLQQGSHFVDEVGASSDPRGRALFANMTDRDRARLYDLVNSDRPSGTTGNLDKQASDWALSKSPATVGDYVNYVEMYVQKFRDRLAAETTAYRTRIEVAVAAGESERSAETRLSTALFGEPVAGTGPNFRKKLGELLEAQFGMPGDPTKAGPGATAASSAFDANAAALRAQGGIGAAKIGTAASEADAIARLRALTELPFSTQSAGAYHVEKHVAELPPSEITGTTPDARARDYLASALKTVRTGEATPGVNQDGTRTVTFLRSFEEADTKYHLQAIVVLTEDGKAFLATYFNKSKK